MTLGPLGLGLLPVLGGRFRGGGGGAPTPTPTPTILVAEGDSITSGASTHAGQWITANSGTITGHNQAIGGSRIIAGGGANGLDERQATALAYGPAQALSVHIGANDLVVSGTYANTAAWLADLEAYLAPFKAAGWRIAVGTVLPRGDSAEHNTRRTAANAAIRGWIGTKIDTVYDFDRTIMGEDATTANLTYFDADQLHPTATGQAAMFPAYKGALNTLFDIPNEVTQFTFTDVSGATGGNVYEAEIVISGLGYGETKPYSVPSGKEVRKRPFGGAWGAYTVDGSGTVENGDRLGVRDTATMTPGGGVGVALTVGGVSDTFNITTANELDPLSGTFEQQQVAGPLGFVASHDFTGIAAPAGKAIFAFMTTQGSVPTSVTYKGVAATLRATASSGSIAAKITFWDVDVASTGTGTLTVAATGGLQYLGFAQWSTEANAAYVDNRKVEYYASADPGSTPSLTLPDGGLILAAALANAAGGFTVAGAGTTERDDDVLDGWTYWSGDRASTGAVSLNGIQFTGGHILAVSYEPT